MELRYCSSHTSNHRESLMSPKCQKGISSEPNMLSWQSVTKCGLWGGTARVLDWKDLGLTHNTNVGYEGLHTQGMKVWTPSWKEPKSTHSHKTNKHMRGKLTHTNAFAKRRGKCPITRCTNTQARDKNTHMRVRMPLWRGEVLGFPKPSPSQAAQTHKQETKQTHTHTHTHTKGWMPLWGGELHDFPKLAPAQHTNTQARDKNTHECPNASTRRRGAWFLETFPVTRFTHETQV